MAYATTVILHVGSLADLTLLEYLHRVLLHLFAFGGLALLVRWVVQVEPEQPFR